MALISRDHLCKLEKDSNALHMRIIRSKAPKSAYEVEKKISRDQRRFQPYSGSRPRFHLKEKGAISDAACSMICKLAALGVPYSKIQKASEIVLGAAGVAVEGSFDTKLVTRIVQEGYVASVMQIMLQLFASHNCRPVVRSRGMACAALRVTTRLLRARRDSYG
jgi:hypothetical protein